MITKYNDYLIYVNASTSWQNWLSNVNVKRCICVGYSWYSRLWFSCENECNKTLWFKILRLMALIRILFLYIFLYSSYNLLFSPYHCFWFTKRKESCWETINFSFIEENNSTINDFLLFCWQEKIETRTLWKITWCASFHGSIITKRDGNEVVRICGKICKVGIAQYFHLLF